MLVTCPECGAKISEEADPCPKCGLPDAGFLSKESTEQMAQAMVNTGRYESIPGVERLSKIGCQCPFTGKWRVTKAEARRLPGGTGYTVYFWIECPKCGKLTEGHYGR